VEEGFDELRARLLDWYDTSGRSLPWRVRPEDRARGVRADPYAVWLSEIMLQQTTVAHAAPYWRRFLALWPRVADLAAAPSERVMAEWAGLGYYARARNLHACAKAVCARHDGVFPDEIDALRALPGIGEYTANAVRAVAFDQPASVVDGNVERVITRLFALSTPLPKAKPEIKRRAAEIASPERPGDYAQAIMDLGATVCTPRNPACGRCVWASACRARREGRQADFPVKAPKKAKPQRVGVCFHVMRGGSIWLRRRPDSGLLGGMMELPGGEWAEAPAKAAPPFPADWSEIARVRHVFTHFELELSVLAAEPPAGWEAPDGEWADASRLDEAGLPSVFLKAARAGLKGALL